MQKGSIGIFDSGVGGLTVAKAVRELMPNEQIIYFGDTLHLPYGEKSSQSIIRYSEKISDFLLDRDCKAIVIACNSASAHAFDHLRKRIKNTVPVLNVIDPMIAHVKSGNKANSVGVIGTKATIRSKVYQNRLKPLACKCLETPLLASMIEEGFVQNEISRAVLKTYLSKSEIQGIDSLILGCTHYPLLKPEIDEYYGGKVNVLDSSAIVAEALQDILTKNNLNNNVRQEEISDEFYVSDYTAFFKESTSKFFGEEIELKELKIT